MTVLIAVRSAMVRVGDRVHRVRRRRTTAHADSQVAREYPDLWEPLTVDFPAEPDPEPAKIATTAPSAKAVRAWAKAQGIDVPDRGKLPDEVVARYTAEAPQEG